jgi:hypothetical protein
LHLFSPICLLIFFQAAAFPDTIYGPESTQHRLESETADNLTWNRFANREPGALSHETELALAHITFHEASSATPLADCIDRVSKLGHAEQELGAQQMSRKNVMIIAGRGRRLATENHHDELKSILASGSSSKKLVGGDARKTVGDVGAAFIVAGPAEASILIMQSAHNSTDI